MFYILERIPSILYIVERVIGACQFDPDRSDKLFKNDL
jgi:hypothetical protein